MVRPDSREKLRMAASNSHGEPTFLFCQSPYSLPARNAQGGCKRFFLTQSNLLHPLKNNRKVLEKKSV